MSAPKRIQLRRTKGWRKPEGAVMVARPSRWGNPYKLGEPAPVVGEPMTDREDLVIAYRYDLDCCRIFNPDGYQMLVAEMGAELGGKDLACWCPLDQPCHADVLLEVANAEAGQ